LNILIFSLDLFSWAIFSSEYLMQSIGLTVGVYYIWCNLDVLTWLLIHF